MPPGATCWYTGRCDGAATSVWSVHTPWKFCCCGLSGASPEHQSVAAGSALSSLRLGPLDRPDEAIARAIDALLTRASQLRVLDLSGESLAVEGALAALSRGARATAADVDAVAWDAPGRHDEARVVTTGRVPARREDARVLGFDDLDLEDNARAPPRASSDVEGNILASLV